MGPSKRKIGISTYLEAFMLIAVASAGAAIVYTATKQYEPAAQGPAVAVSNAIIRQGTNQAIEKMLVQNTGTVSFSSFTITVVGVSTSGTYCLSLLDPATGSTISASCPAAGTNPGSVTTSASVGPGQSVLVSITIYGGVTFTIGARYSVIVSTSAAAQQQLQVVVIPA